MTTLKINRRDFLKLSGLGTAAALLPTGAAVPVAFVAAAQKGNALMVTTATPETLTTVLQSATAGDEIVLSPGVYHGDRTWSIPYLTVRAEGRAILNGRQDLRGRGTAFQDIEITDLSYTDRTQIGKELCQLNAPNIRLERCVIHDGYQGIIGGGYEGCETIDCIVYHCGRAASSQGHNIYPQNQTGSKRFVNCIVFDSFGYGVHAYSTLPKLNGLEFIDMILFGAGVLRTDTDSYAINLHIGGEQLGNDCLIKGCLCYHDNTRKWGGARVGYHAAVNNAFVINNIFTPIKMGEVLSFMKGLPTAMTGNKFYGVLGYNSAPMSPSLYPVNEYLGSAFPDLVKVNPCVSKCGRAHVAIVNGSLLNNVMVDVPYPDDAVIQARNVQDYFNDIQTLTVTNGKVNINMQAVNRTVETPIGWTAPATTFPRFGAFVLEGSYS